MLQTATKDDPRLTLARHLVAALEDGNETGADELLGQLTAERESDLFRQVGRLTRELHDALRNVQLDSRLSELAAQDIPDAKQRLNYVIVKTEEAAHRTLGAIEELMPMSQRIEQAAGAIMSDWARFTRREMDVAEFRELSHRVSEFLERIREDSRRIHGGLAEVLLAQDFQDLTGQVIRKIMELVQEVEDNLVHLIRRQGGVDADAAGGGADAEGPVVLERQRAHVVNGQDEVDELLSSLGF